jgi:hypothetical protein
MAVRLSGLPLCSKETFTFLLLVHISVRGCESSMIYCDRKYEVCCQKSFTSSDLEPATLRLVAQYLDYYAIDASQNPRAFPVLTNLLDRGIV